MPSSSFSSATIAAYLQQTPNSIFTLTCNPYADTSCLTTPVQVMLDVEDAVCAYKYVLLPDGTTSCGQYVMVTYPSTAAALEDNGILTHSGSCGLCSTTQDLAVYLSKSRTHIHTHTTSISSECCYLFHEPDEDFTAAGKKCATMGLINEQKGMECYMNIGLTMECAKIWNYDGIYDGKACGTVCTQELNDPNNGPPPACALNDCLQCDEENAGPTFSSFAGRTRRRSGLLSEIVRSCSSISHIDHVPCGSFSN